MTNGNKVLTTGAAGFIGSRFVNSCNEKGIEVISVDRENYFSDHPLLGDLNFGKTIDWHQLPTEICKLDPEISSVVHLGACSSTMETDPKVFEVQNVKYSKMLWEFCSKKNIPFVYASSAATYGDGTLGYDDSHDLIPQLKPLNLYGQSKQDFDLWVLEQKPDFTPPCWSGLKFFNVYGFGEHYKGNQASVVFHAYNQIKSTGTMKLFKSHKEGIEDGHQKRDFIYVDDVTDMIHFCLEKPIKSGIFNVGSGKARTFMDLVKATFKSLGVEPNIEFIPTPESIRDKYQYFTEAKMDKIRSEGYLKPTTELEDGIEKYISLLEEASNIQN